MPASWAELIKSVMGELPCKLSDFTGARKRAAIHLIDRGKVASTSLPNGDYLIERL